MESIRISWKFINKKERKMRDSSFISIEVYNECGKAMFSLLNLIIAHSLPISIIREQGFRDQTKFDLIFSQETVKKVISKLVEIV